MAASSTLFQPFQTCGIAAGEAPPAFHSLGTETFACVPVDRAFQVYDVATLRLVAVSAVHEAAVKCVRKLSPARAAGRTARRLCTAGTCS